MMKAQRRSDILQSAMAIALALSVLVQAAPPAAAQRRYGEPEANPQVQPQASESPATGGAPIEAAPAGLASEAAAPRNVQGVQIGTPAPARPSAAAAPVSPLQTRVTVRVKGAPLETFLDTIQAQAHVNFIVTEGLESKRVTAFLQNVTVAEALQVLLEIKGLTYQQIGHSNTYIVAPRSKAIENVITRIYQLSYIPLIPLGDSASDAAAITPASNTPGGNAGGGGAGAGTGGAPAVTAGGSSGAVSFVSVLRSVLTKTGEIALEPRTNSIVVTDIPEVFPQVEQIIAELDKKAPQVMIEAQIVEIDTDKINNLGLEWGGSDGTLGQFNAGSRDVAFPFNITNNLKATHFFDPVTNWVSALGGSTSGSNSSSTNLLGNSVQLGTLNLSQLQIILRALVSNSQARYLSKPKIMTLNNKSAIIEIASQQAVGHMIQNSGGSSLTSSVSAAERYNTGLVLKVTPQVNKDGYITMLVQPSYTDIQASPISTASNPVYDPVTRGASSLVRVRNGQTLVMGGLLRSVENKTVRKVPLLGYIPIIGWLFTSSVDQRSNTDLVIFLTPTIVSD